MSAAWSAWSTPGRPAGVVDEDVELAEAIDRAGDQGLALVLVGDVATEVVPLGRERPLPPPVPASTEDEEFTTTCRPRRGEQRAPTPRRSRSTNR